MCAKNCWEIMNCQRHPGGSKSSKLGVCPAAMDASRNGFNSGKNAGRICWTVPGTLCEDKFQGKFVEKIDSCQKCPFFKSVRDEEKQFILIPPDLEYVPSMEIVKIIFNVFNYKKISQ